MEPPFTMTMTVRCKYCTWEGVYPCRPADGESAAEQSAKDAARHCFDEHHGMATALLSQWGRK